MKFFLFFIGIIFSVDALSSPPFPFSTPEGMDLYYATERGDGSDKPKLSVVVEKIIREAIRKKLPLEFWSDVDLTFLTEHTDEKANREFYTLGQGYEDVLRVLDKYGVPLRFITARLNEQGSLTTLCRQLSDVLVSNVYAKTSPSLNEIKEFCTRKTKVETNDERTVILSNWHKYNFDKGNALGHIVHRNKGLGKKQGMIFFVDDRNCNIQDITKAVKRNPDIFSGWKVINVYFPCPTASRLM